MFSIGELSHRTGVKIPTIRYYEKKGLMNAPSRSAGNQRRYSQQGLERLAFIKHARELGLSLGAIRELIELSGHPREPCAHADRIAREHLATVRARIASLKSLETELARIADGCDGEHVDECYVIRALADHSLCNVEH